MRTPAVAFAILVLVAAIAAVLRWRSETTPRPESRPARESGPAGASLSADAPVASSADHAPPDVQPEPGERVAVPPGSAMPRLARFVGRCVDAATGQPLSGCTLTLQGWEANRGRVEAYGRKIDWQNPEPVVTSADGRFELRFDPPPPFQFVLEIDRSDHATMSGRWSGIASGETKDVGDVAMPAGTELVGTVVDTKGVPQPRAQVYLSREGGRDTEKLQPRPYTNATSAPDGSFSLRHRLGPGVWTLQAGRGTRLKGPESVTIHPTPGRLSLEVVLLAHEELEVIEGVVLDENEQPAPRLVLDPSPRGSGSRWICSTDARGRFRLVREEGDSKEPVSFSSRSEGYERMQDERAFPWGSKDVVLRIRRALSIEVQALDATSGEPITNYGVRCFFAEANGWSSPDAGLRAQGEHPGGVAVVAGVRRGKNRLIVEAADRQTFAPMAPVELEVVDGGPRHVVRVPRFAERLLEVVRHDGTPVAGTRVEALVAVDSQPITLATWALERHEIFRRGNMPQALLVHRGATDHTGRLLLRGPSGSEAVVRLLGPGHVPVLHTGVTWAGGVLRIEVNPGAKLVGKIEPASVVQQFTPHTRGPAGEVVDAQAVARAAARAHADALRLVLSSRTRFPPTFDEGAPVAADGSFEVVDVPPGDWDAMLRFPIFDARGQSVGSSSERLASIAGLQEGETREVRLDARHLVFGVVRGVLYQGDTPCAGALGQLMGTRPDGKGGTWPVSGPSLTTDAAGAFEVKVFPGTWTLWLLLPIEGDQNGRRIPIEPAIDVGSGAVAEPVLRFRRQTLTVRLFDAQGQPCADRAVDVQGEQTWASGRTDGNGVFVLDPALPGLLRFSTWPVELSTQAQRLRAMNEQGGKAVEARRIMLGEQALSASADSGEVTLRLPR